MQNNMTRTDAIFWFVSQTEQTKDFALLEVVGELTIVIRDVFSSQDEPTRLRVAWLMSELTHRLVGHVTTGMSGNPRYPDDVIIGILFDYLETPDLQKHASHVWDRAVEQARRFMKP